MVKHKLRRQEKIRQELTTYKRMITISNNQNWEQKCPEIDSHLGPNS